MNTELRCIFDTPLIVERFSCSQAIPVVRRGGTEINCAQDLCHKRCERLLAHIKPHALSALGTEDDLLTMPRSAILKIHHGILIAVNQLINKQSEPINDVAKLVEQADSHIGKLPMDEIIRAIVNFKTRDRRNKRK